MHATSHQEDISVTLYATTETMLTEPLSPQKQDEISISLETNAWISCYSVLPTSEEYYTQNLPVVKKSGIVRMKVGYDVIDVQREPTDGKGDDDSGE